MEYDYREHPIFRKACEAYDIVYKVIDASFDERVAAAKLILGTPDREWTEIYPSGGGSCYVQWDLGLIPEYGTMIIQIQRGGYDSITERRFPRCLEFRSCR